MMLKKPTVSSWKELSIIMKFKNQRLKKIIQKAARNSNHLIFYISKFCSMFISMKADTFQNETLQELLLKHQSGFTEHASVTAFFQRHPQAWYSSPHLCGKGRTNRGQCKSYILMSWWERETHNFTPFFSSTSPLLPSERRSSAFKTHKFKVILPFLCRIIFCQYTIQLILWSERH